ncbi:hypothetical protein HDU93_007884 [Gonapodya sp. JEL0774]|nr:hypothetical protein HDU93_007884 [Gonapodya sp. JEL0774]
MKNDIARWNAAVSGAPLAYGERTKRLQVKEEKKVFARQENDPATVLQPQTPKLLGLKQVKMVPSAYKAPEKTEELLKGLGPKEKRLRKTSIGAQPKVAVKTLKSRVLLEAEELTSGILIPIFKYVNNSCWQDVVLEEIVGCIPHVHSLGEL